MQRNPSLLVCLSPSVPLSQVNELVFFYLVDQITPVKNVRMIAVEGQVKAFVQVEDQKCAEMVIAALNGRLMNIGKVKVFISNKSFVNYEQRLSQVLERCMKEEREEPSAIKRDSYSTLFGLNGPSRQLDNRTENPHSFLNNVAENKNGGMPLDESTEKSRKPVLIKMDDFLELSALSQPSEEQPTATSPINPLHVIKITHEVEEALLQKRMLRVFRRFGRVMDMSLSAEAKCWTIVYRSTKDVEKAVTAINEGKLFGYRLLGPNYSQTSINQRGRNDKACKQKPPVIAQKPRANAALRVSFRNMLMSIGSLAVLVSKIHLPSKITCFTNPKTSKCYYVVEYDYLYQAAEALISFSQLSSEIKGCKVRFAGCTD